MKRILIALLLLWPGSAFSAELVQRLPRETCLAARSVAAADEQLLQWTRCLAQEKLTDKERAAAYVARAVLYEQKRDLENAFADFNSAIAADPTLAIAYAGRGVLYLARKDASGAIADLTTAIKLDPALLQAYVARGTAFITANRPDDAIADFTTVIKIEPKLTLTALELRSLAYAAKKDWAGAIADCTAALKLSDAVGLYAIRAAAYVNSRQYDKAIPDFSAIIARDPSSAAAYNNRAVAYIGLKKYKLAITDLTTAISLAPGEASFYTTRAATHDEIGNCKSALDDFDHALTLGEDGIAFNGKAWVRATCPDSAYRNGAEAVELAIKAIQLGAGDQLLNATMATPFHMTLAAAYAESGQFEDAVREQELAIKLLTSDARDELRNETKLALAAFKAKKPFRWPVDELVSSLTNSIVASGLAGSSHLPPPRLARDAASPILPRIVEMPAPPAPKLPIPSGT